MPSIARHQALTSRLFAACCLLIGGLACLPAAHAQTQLQLGLRQLPESQPNNPQIDPGANASPGRGPIRLQAPQIDPRPSDERMPAPPEGAAYVPGEFEKFVQTQAGMAVPVRRLGSDMVTSGGLDARVADFSPLAPAEYIVATGDEVLVNLWGSVEADLRLVVDRSGRIAIPRVGTIQVAGVRLGDLQEVVSRRVATVFKNYQISVGLGQLRGIRVFVSGFVVKPGVYNVSSLSTVVSALMRAGGPAASGSFRSVELRRGGMKVSSFDLYDLMTAGDRSADQIVQSGDVVHVGPVGIQIGFIGSVNRPTVLELKPGETVADALRLAGGFSAVADRNRLAIERLQERNAAKVSQLDLPEGLKQTLSHGDLLRAFSAADVVLPGQRQSKRVRVEGEVVRPAEYVLPKNSTVSDALRLAGGLTPNAYLQATEFTRESVRIMQQQNYERALHDLETDLARAAGSQRVSNAEEAANVSARSNASSRLVERLRTLKPSGRIVLQMPAGNQALPDLVLEDGDRILVPAKSTTVGIFGSVFNAASYLHLPDRTLDDYMRLAGGPTKGADKDSIFVVRANGSVVSNLQGASSWYSRSDQVGKMEAMPGDTLFVPEEMNKTTFLQNAKDWTLLLYQMGIGLAGINSALR